MIVVLTGAPGAGKGTQSDLLAQREGYRKLSTGDALRKHVKLGTAIGKIAGSLMERGALVPDDVLLGILREELGGISSDQVVLLDGYPRNLAQAESLEGLRQSHPIKAVIQLDVPRPELVSRLSGRRVCSGCGATYHVEESPTKKPGVCDRCGGVVAQRADDKPESVAVRLEVYERETKPILDYYRKQGVFREVRGLGGLEEIYTQLRGLIAGL